MIINNLTSLLNNLKLFCINYLLLNRIALELLYTLLGNIYPFYFLCVYFAFAGPPEQIASVLRRKQRIKIKFNNGAITIVDFDKAQEYS